MIVTNGLMEESCNSTAIRSVQKSIESLLVIQESSLYVR